MRNVFTKFLMVLCFVWMTTMSFAQNLNTLTINSPAGLVGNYALLRPTWGSQSNNTITADAVFSAPGEACVPLTNNGSGKIVFVDRGTCGFDVKSLNAQNAGAVAVIICNNLPAPQPLFVMAAGPGAPQITIPVFLATQETCNKLRVDLSSGSVNATIGFKCDTPTYPSNAVWGDVPGEGDFSDSLKNWTVDKGWIYNAEGIIRNGAYTGAPILVGSPTACNGVAEFNSDYLDNRGMTNADGSPVAGAGDCPSPCTGYLLSPNITFDQPLEALAIEFSQSLRNYQSQYYLMISRDGGATFSDTVRFNTEHPLNSNHITERKRIGIPGFEGVTSIRFKFEYVGNYYYWALDDIVIFDGNYVDLQVNRDWYSVAPYYKMPTHQVSEIPFMADISNIGTSVAENTVLNINVNGPSTSESFELFYGDVAAGSIWENRPYPIPYMSPSTVGRYTAEYFLTSPDEEDGPNNRASFEWHVTENTFANLDNEAQRGAYMQFYATPWAYGGAVRIYSVGNVYYVPNGEDYVATKVRYGLANTLADVTDQALRIDLFEWVDLDNDEWSTPIERTRVGTNFEVITNAITNLRSIETDIWASDEDGFAIEGERVQLKDDTHYIIVVSVTPNSPETDPQMQLLGFTPRSLTNYDRSIGAMNATNFALDSLEALGAIGPRAGGTLIAYENIVNTSVEDIDQRLLRSNQNGLLYTKVYVEMDVVLATNTNEEVLPTIAVKTFPNPASRDLFVDLNLEKASGEVHVSMFNMEGKLVSTKTFYNVMDDRLKLDVSTMTNGAYSVKVVTSEGVATRKVIINN